MTNDRIVTGVKTLGGNDPWAHGQSFMTVEQMQAEIETLRSVLSQMTPDYEYMISDAADRGTYEETWLEECRQIAAYARAALQPKEGEG